LVIATAGSVARSAHAAVSDESIARATVEFLAVPMVLAWFGLLYAAARLARGGNRSGAAVVAFFFATPIACCLGLGVGDGYGAPLGGVCLLVAVTAAALTVAVPGRE
jgi:hypothetical protein